MMPFDDLRTGSIFVAKLFAYLRHPLDTATALSTLRARLKTRGDDFLGLVRRAIYEHPASVYGKLLRMAGCDYAELERKVNKDGLEAALQALFRAGVYLTVEEFKGRKPIVRGNMTLEVTPQQLRNPFFHGHILANTSASRSSGTPVHIDMAFIRECAVDTLLALHARGGGSWQKAHWQVPGGGAIARVVEFSSFGDPVAHWFSHIDPKDGRMHARYRASAALMRWGSLLARVPLPCPEHVPLARPSPILHWMAEVLKRGGSPHLFTFTTSAVRLCQAALEAGMDLRGAHFTVVGEPLTPARAELIRQSGAGLAPRYAIIECGSIGHGCLLPEVPDDVHLLEDLYALIQPGADSDKATLPTTALLLSSLRPTAPFILLNVCMGDQAVVEKRSCGCPLETLGWRTHLHSIRSYEKLTAGGMTFLDFDIVHVLEEVLPAHFGGGPTDYQLVEEETDMGKARLRLVVHPRVGHLEKGIVRERFFSAIGEGGGAAKVMALMWREAGLLEIERRSPYVTSTGKILHLHQYRRVFDHEREASPAV